MRRHTQRPLDRVPVRDRMHASSACAVHDQLRLFESSCMHLTLIMNWRRNGTQRMSSMHAHAYVYGHGYMHLTGIAISASRATKAFKPRRARAHIAHATCTHAPTEPRARVLAMHVHVYMCCNVPGHACAMAAGALCNVSYWPGATQGRAATTGTCTGGVDTKIRMRITSSSQVATPRLFCRLRPVFVFFPRFGILAANSRVYEPGFWANGWMSDES